MTGGDRDPGSLKLGDGGFQRLPGCRRRHGPAVGLQDCEPTRGFGSRRRCRAVETWKSRIATGALRDLAGDLPCLRQACGKGAVDALGQAIITAATVDGADRRLEAEAAAETRRPQDRAEDLGAEPDADGTDCYRRGGAAAGAAGRSSGVPRIARV